MRKPEPGAEQNSSRTAERTAFICHVTGRLQEEVPEGSPAGGSDDPVDVHLPVRWSIQNQNQLIPPESHDQPAGSDQF